MTIIATATASRPAGNVTGCAVAEEAVERRPVALHEAVAEDRDEPGDQTGEQLVADEPAAGAGDERDHHEAHGPDERQVGGDRPTTVEHVWERPDEARRSPPRCHRPALLAMALMPRSTPPRIRRT